MHLHASWCICYVLTCKRQINIDLFKEIKNSLIVSFSRIDLTDLG